MTETILRAGHGERRHIDWRAGVYAGLIGGAVFMMLEMGMVWLFMGESPMGPAAHDRGDSARRGRAAHAARQASNVQPGRRNDGDDHSLALSIIYGLIGAVIVAHRMGHGGAITLGALAGLVIYWISIFAHVVFGAVVGWAYVGLRRPALQR